LSPNFYAIRISIPTGKIYQFRLAGQHHHFEFPEEVIGPERKETGNVYGCGILLNPDEKLTIFFTLNGILIGSVLIFPCIFFLDLLHINDNEP
jgi:hypothetical protein